jgi:cytochrome c-type biogenesis protein CcmH
MRKLFLSICIVFFGLFSLPSFAAEGAADVKPNILDPVANKRVAEIASQLRCLVCQNQSIADSNAELAVDLKNQVVKQIAQGKTNEQIISYMVERYGDFVLYNPPFKLSTALLWIGPGVLFVAALVWLFTALARRRREVAEQRPLTEEEKKRAEALLSGAGFEETASGRKA